MMSYARMDHAEWVQLQIAPSKNRLTPSERRSGKGWADAPDHLSLFHAKVFDILGMVFGGIYNAPIAWRAVDWHAGSGLGIPVTYASLATFDFAQLTRLVFLCHEARIRGEISAHGPKGLLMHFHQRLASGGMSRRHPNLIEALAEHAEFLPTTHRIIYRELEAASEGASA